MKLKKLLTSIFATVASVCLAFGIGTLVTTEVKAEDTVTTETTFTEVDVTRSTKVHYWSNTVDKGTTNPNYTFLINFGKGINVKPYATSGSHIYLNDNATKNECDVMSYVQLNGVTLRSVVGANGSSGSSKGWSASTDSGFGLPGFAPIQLKSWNFDGSDDWNLNGFELLITQEYIDEACNGIENLEITVMEGIAWKNTDNQILKTTSTVTYKMADPTKKGSPSYSLDRVLEKLDITDSVKTISLSETKDTYYVFYSALSGATWAPYCGASSTNPGKGVQLFLNDNANTNGCDLASYVLIDGVSARTLVQDSSYTQYAQYEISAFKPIVVCADGYWGGLRLQLTKEYVEKHHGGSLEGLEITLKAGFTWDNVEYKTLYTTEDITWKYKDGAFVDTFVSSASVSCQDSLDLNFYVTARDSVQAVTGTFNNATESVNGVFDSEKGMWKFTYSVAAKDFAQDVNLTLNNGKTWTTSVKDYLDSIIAEGETNKAYEVASTLKAYCQAAQTYFAGEAATATDALTADLSAYKATQSGEQDGVAVQGATLVLEGKTHIRIYFTANDMTGVVCKVGESEVTPEALQDGRYVIMIENLTATELDTMYTISIGDMTITYGALSYVAVAHDDANVALANVVKALYAYSYAAEDYFKNN